MHVSHLAKFLDFARHSPLKNNTHEKRLWQVKPGFFLHSKVGHLFLPCWYPSDTSSAYLGIGSSPEGYPTPLSNSLLPFQVAVRPSTHLLFGHVRVLAPQLYLTVGHPMGCSPPGSSVHGILQARMLEWVAIPFSRGSFWPRDWT